MIQTAAAAAIAYFLTAFFLGIDYQQAFYAPIAAVVCLSLTLGQPKRRAILVAIGVAVGLTVASLIVLAIGVGPAQMGLVVALAMATALLFSGRTLFINQAAISAILVVVLQPPQQYGFSPDRFVDALVGGGVALAINYLFPADPERMVERAARPIFEELVSTLEEVATALRDGDLDTIGRALSQARGIDERVSSFRSTVTAGQETARFAPFKRGELGHLQVYADVVDRIDLAVRGGRSVTRAAMGVVRHGSPASVPLSEAVHNLSEAVQALAAYLEQPGDPEDVRRIALDAASKATAALKEHGGDLATSVLVGQIRTTTLDLLMSTGMDDTQALQALEEAAGSASEIG
ncbi:MAG: FUSC family protein [Actinomycetota bacterium]|nr:FUSC family protein [Actinomycetota bacterium]